MIAPIQLEGLLARLLRDYQFQIGGKMPFHLGTTELVIILVIVILLFGVGRIGRLGKDFGHAISEFRKAVTFKEVEEKDEV